MPAYNDVYVASVMKAQGKLFLKIRDKLPGVDEKWFVEAYMQSTIRELLDDGNVKYVNAPANELMLRFIEDECGGEYNRGAQWGGFLPEWAGRIYALYQWKYETPSRDLIKVLPLDEVERVFPALHQAGWEAAVDKIHEFVLNNQ